MSNSSDFYGGGGRGGSGLDPAADQTITGNWDFTKPLDIQNMKLLTHGITSSLFIGNSVAPTTAITAEENTLIGSKQGENLNSGTHNTYVGAMPSSSLTSGLRNTGVGYSAGRLVSTGTDNTFLGYKAGQQTIGNNNIVIGSEAEARNPNANDQLSIGKNSVNLPLIEGNQGTDVVHINGTLTATSGVIPEAPVDGTGYIRKDAAWEAVAGTGFDPTSNQTITGDWSFDNPITVDSIDIHAGDTTSSVYVGNDAGVTALSTATNNTTVGYHAGDAILSGRDNTAIGSHAANFLNTGVGNTFIGSSAGGNVTTGNNNTFLGTGSGANTAAGGSNNICVGYGARIPTGYPDNHQLVIGKLGTTNNPLIEGDMTDVATAKVHINGTLTANAGILPEAPNDGNQYARKNEGWEIVTSATPFDPTANQTITGDWTFSEPIFVEDWTAIRNGDNRTSVYMGYFAGNGANNTNSNNVIIGNQRAQNIQDNSTHNTMIGSGAYVANMTGSFNTTLGYGAGSKIEDGDKNILIGYNTGDTITNGANNILIGDNLDPANPTDNGKLMIGNTSTTGTALIQGDQTLNTVHINGTLSADTIVGGGGGAGGAWEKIAHYTHADAVANRLVIPIPDGYVQIKVIVNRIVAAAEQGFMTMEICNGSGVSLGNISAHAMSTSDYSPSPRIHRNHTGQSALKLPETNCPSAFYPIAGEFVVHDKYAPMRGEFSSMWNETDADTREEALTTKFTLAKKANKIDSVAMSFSSTNLDDTDLADVAISGASVLVIGITDTI